MEFVVDTSKPAKNIKELQGRIEELRNTIEGAPLGSEDFERLTGQLSNASSEMKVLEKNMEGLEPQQKAEAFLKMGEGIAGAFAVGQGAMGLMGVESENLEKIQVKVQSAIAIATGVRMMSEAALMAATAKRVIAEKAGLVATKAAMVITKANTIANIAAAVAQKVLSFAIGTSTVALHALKVAIAATGIGALVIGVVSLVSAMSSWFSSSEETSGSTSNLSDEMDRLKEKIKGTLDASREYSDRKREIKNADNEHEAALLKLNNRLEDQVKETNSLNNVYATLKANYKSMQKSYGYYSADMEKHLKTIKKQVDASEAYEETLKNLQEVQKNVIKGYNNATQAIEDNNKKSEDASKKRREQRKTDAENLRKLENELLLLEKQDLEERAQLKREQELADDLADAKKIKSRKIRLATLQNIQDIYDQEELNRKKKKDDEIEKLHQAHLDEMAEMDQEYKDELLGKEADYLDEYYQSLVSAENQEKNAVYEKYFELIERADEYGLNKADLVAAQNAELQLINDTYREEEDEKEREVFDAKLDSINQLADAFSANMDARLTELNNAHQRELDVEGLTNAQKEKINKKYQKKKDRIAKRQKAIQASQAIINTFVGATRAIADLGPIAGPIAAAAISIGGAAAVRQIYAQDVGDGGAGGDSSTPEEVGPPKTSGSFTLSGASEEKPLKAYVVTDEMTDSQNQLEDIRQESTI